MISGGSSLNGKGSARYMSLTYTDTLAAVGLEEAANRYDYVRLKSMKGYPELDEAIQRLWHEDESLLIRGAHERSICHCLAKHLARAHNRGLARDVQWAVGCEYNLFVIRPFGPESLDEVVMRKYLELSDHNYHDVYPDIIVHKRDRTDNELVIEAKVFRGTSWGTKISTDFEKLTGFTNRNGAFHYRKGVLLVFLAGN